jgi:hypothetical protein
MARARVGAGGARQHGCDRRVLRIEVRARDAPLAPLAVIDDRVAGGHGDRALVRCKTRCGRCETHADAQRALAHGTHAGVTRGVELEAGRGAGDERCGHHRDELEAASVTSRILGRPHVAAVARAADPATPQLERMQRVHGGRQAVDEGRGLVQQTSMFGSRRRRQRLGV